jgi:hypothetical protein
MVWLDEVCGHIDGRRYENGHWNNKDVCLEEMKKYKTKTEFCKENPTAWNYSKINGWLYEYYGNNNESRSGSFLGSQLYNMINK